MPNATRDTLAQLSSHYAGKRCLVTGGLGFIGSNLTLALVEAGARVTVVDSLEPRHGGDRRNIEDAPVDVVIGDIGEPDAVRDPLAGAEYVFNLAGQVSHLDSMTDPLHDLEINARSQLAFLEELRRISPKARLVYSSTRQVYGRPQVLPVDETHPLDPVDVNGVSKLAADRLHRLYHRVHGVPATVLRLSNVYGPRQRLDGDHQGFLPAFLRRAIEGEPITVFGDGSQQRDCIYVDDALRALLAAAWSPSAPGEVFNIGHHEHLSLLEIAEIVVAAAGSGEVLSAPWPEERQRIAIDSYWTDYGKAARVLGWEPTISLAEGLAETLANHRSRLAWQA
jgi:UDP-glucose 4-epimerase